jgi:hypothetical protein
MQSPRLRSYFGERSFATTRAQLDADRDATGASIRLMTPAFSDDAQVTDCDVRSKTACLCRDSAPFAVPTAHVRAESPYELRLLGNFRLIELI